MNTADLNNNIAQLKFLQDYNKKIYNNTLVMKLQYICIYYNRKRLQ